MSTKRKSSRLSKKPLTIDSNTNDPYTATRNKPKRHKSNGKDLDWSVSQKKRLLSAMKRHGCQNISGIADEFPEFTKTNVRVMIAKMIKVSKNKVFEGDENKSQTGWQNTTLYTIKKPAITRALKYISMFERLPVPDDCADCDFSALYKFLSNATLGKTGLDASVMTHETLNHVVDSVTEEVMYHDELEVRQQVKQEVDRQKNKRYDRLIF